MTTSNPSDPVHAVCVGPKSAKTTPGVPSASQNDGNLSVVRVRELVKECGGNNLVLIEKRELSVELGGVARDVHDFVVLFREGERRLVQAR